jgi:hypothetical protein
MKLKDGQAFRETGAKSRGGSAVDLPSATDPSLILAQTTEQERNKQLTINGVQWRGALSLPAYIRREHHLAQQEVTKNGGLTSWALVDSLHTKRRNMLCGCETYRRKALIAQRGVVNEVTVHGVGSVFCPEEFRGRGYAGRMMKEVGQKLCSWQTKKGETIPFTVLFSDIGKV